MVIEIYPPCDKCNAEGNVYGERHAKVWNKYYSSLKR